jgi:hypothetical protein
MTNKTFVFTVTTGRSGTVFLTNLLSNNLNNANIYHERTGPYGFGIHTPEASHFMQYNHFGVTKRIREFWLEKLQLALNESGNYYIETSHFLSKAGLIENLDILPNDVSIKIIYLTRETDKIALSFFNRGTFQNFGWTWLFTLDPRYSNIIISSRPFMQFGPMGHSLWYVLEMRARAEYYKNIIQNDPRIEWITTSARELSSTEQASYFLQSIQNTHTVTTPIIPEKKNQTQQSRITEAQRQKLLSIYRGLNGNPEELGQWFYDSGRRLSHPQHSHYIN